MGALALTREEGNFHGLWRHRKHEQNEAEVSPVEWGCSDHPSADWPEKFTLVYMRRGRFLIAISCSSAFYDPKLMENKKYLDFNYFQFSSAEE
jgi:hypothetical protein